MMPTLSNACTSGSNQPSTCSASTLQIAHVMMLPQPLGAIAERYAHHVNGEANQQQQAGQRDRQIDHPAVGLQRMQVRRRTLRSTPAPPGAER